MRRSKTQFWDHCMTSLPQEQFKRDSSFLVFVLCPGDKKVLPFSSSLSEYGDLYLPWKDLVDVGDSLMNIFSFPVVCSAFSRKREKASSWTKNCRLFGTKPQQNDSFDPLWQPAFYWFCHFLCLWKICSFTKLKSRLVCLQALMER